MQIPNDFDFSMCAVSLHITVVLFKKSALLKSGTWEKLEF